MEYFSSQFYDQIALIRDNRKTFLELINSSFERFICYGRLISYILYHNNLNLFKILHEINKCPSKNDPLMMTIILSRCDDKFLSYVLNNGWMVKPSELVRYGSGFGANINNLEMFQSKIKIIIAHGMDINVKIYGEICYPPINQHMFHNILHMIILYGCIKAVKFLLQNDVIVEYSHLEYASYRKDLEIFKLIHDQEVWNLSQLEPIIEWTKINCLSIYQFLTNTDNS